eukprot:TRINITY_DN4953_c0_g1_i1.p1 TRINITY_DN4953_c0_g1~~TRINITY_DN4953_c0_g1_i1.p1  ORF type:complete len:666 (+),score=176.04 TRINITY_DN4953_c0_g1_i1:114-2111(+)
MSTNGIPRGRKLDQEEDKGAKFTRKASRSSDKAAQRSNSKTRKATARTSSIPRRSSSKATIERSVSLQQESMNRLSMPRGSTTSLVSAKAEIETLKTKLQEAEEKDKNWASLTERLKQEYYTAMQQWGDMEQSVQKTQEEIGRKRRQEIKNLEQVLEEERAKRREADNKLVTEFKDKDNLIAEMRSQEAALMADLRISRQQNDEYVGEIERLRLELSTTQKLLASKEKDFDVLKTLETQKRELLVAEHRAKEDELRKQVEDAQKGQQYQLRRFKELKERYMLKKKAHSEARIALTEGAKELVELKVRLGALEQQNYEKPIPGNRIEYPEDKMMGWTPSARSSTPDRYGHWSSSKSRPRIRWTSHSPPSLRAAVPFCATVKGTTPPLHILDNGPSKHSPFPRDAPQVDHSFRWVPPPSLRAYYEDNKGNRVLHAASRRTIPVNKSIADYRMPSTLNLVRSRSAGSAARRTNSPPLDARHRTGTPPLEGDKSRLTSSESGNAISPQSIEIEKRDEVAKIETGTDPIVSPKVDVHVGDSAPMDVESVAPPNLASPMPPPHETAHPPLPPKASIASMSVDVNEVSPPPHRGSGSPVYSTRSASRKSFSDGGDVLETHSDTTSIVFIADKETVGGSVIDRTENATELFSLDPSSSASSSSHSDADSYDSS